VDTDARLAEVLIEISEGTWTGPAGGISLDPYETIIAVLTCVAQTPSLHEGLVSAVQLGGAPRPDQPPDGSIASCPKGSCPRGS